MAKIALFAAIVGLAVSQPAMAVQTGTPAAPEAGTSTAAHAGGIAGLGSTATIGIALGALAAVGIGVAVGTHHSDHRPTSP